jgi:hypothetical protein
MLQLAVDATDWSKSLQWLASTFVQPCLQRLGDTFKKRQTHRKVWGLWSMNLLIDTIIYITLYQYSIAVHNTSYHSNPKRQDWSMSKMASCHETKDQPCLRPINKPPAKIDQIKENRWIFYDYLLIILWLFADYLMIIWGSGLFQELVPRCSNMFQRVPFVFCLGFLSFLGLFSAPSQAWPHGS